MSTLKTDEDFMRCALAQARAGESAGEVPVGAVIVRDGVVVATGSNRNLSDNDPTAHAEVVAIRAAAKKLGNHRLGGCELFVTIEPCAMCAGAMVHARLTRLIFGAADPKAGAVESVMQVLSHPALNHRMAVTTGILAEDCTKILQSFFRNKRAAL